MEEEEEEEEGGGNVDNGNVSAARATPARTSNTGNGIVFPDADDDDDDDDDEFRHICDWDDISSITLTLILSFIRPRRKDEPERIKCSNVSCKES